MKFIVTSLTHYFHENLSNTHENLSNNSMYLWTWWESKNFVSMFFFPSIAKSSFLSDFIIYRSFSATHSESVGSSITSPWTPSSCCRESPWAEERITGFPLYIASVRVKPNPSWIEFWTMIEAKFYKEFTSNALLSLSSIDITKIPI